MKRLVTLMVIGAVTALLTGCGQQSPKPTDIKPEATVPAQHSATAPAAPTAAPAEAAPAAPAH